MDVGLFDKYKQVKKHRIENPTDVLKLDVLDFFKPKDKVEKAILFGCFSKYHHDKIRDALTTCEKGFKHTEDIKYKNPIYFRGIIKNLK